MSTEFAWPEENSEHKINMMFGGLHIELAAPKTLVEWGG